MGIEGKKLVHSKLRHIFKKCDKKAVFLALLAVPFNTGAGVIWEGCNFMHQGRGGFFFRH